MATLGELATYSSIRDWSLTGPDAVVKVVATEEADRVVRAKSALGYVTQAKYLAGKNAFQIERDLGLRPESLRKGAFVFYFAKLPALDGVEQRYTANFPDGGVWTEEQQKDYFLAREHYRTSHATRVEHYPPGSERVKQRKLTRPLPISGRFLQVTTSTTFNLL